MLDEQLTVGVAEVVGHAVVSLVFKTDGYASINDVRTVEQIIQLCDAVATTDC